MQDALFWVGSLEYTYDELQIAAEYARYSAIFEMSLAPIIAHAPFNQERYYVQLSYRFSEWLQAATYYSAIFDADDPTGERTYDQPGAADPQPKYKAWMKEIVVAMRFDINDYWLLKIEAHLVDGTAQVYEMANKSNPRQERYWTLYGIKTTLTF